MTSLLLIISFLLHVILLISIYQLYKQIQELKQTKNSELHTVAEQFISEIKQENKLLQERLTHHANLATSNDLDQTMNPRQASNESLFQSTLQSNKKNPSIEGLNIEDLTEKKHEEMELSFESKILQLHQQGLNVDQIAERLKCGRTEVDLIVHLQQQLKHNT